MCAPYTHVRGVRVKSVAQFYSKLSFILTKTITIMMVLGIRGNGSVEEMTS